MGKIIGITGGIASGKSTVTEFLRQKGFQVVDADAVVHQLQKPGGQLYQVLVEHFGEKILLENGELNRPLLASLIFSNPEDWLRIKFVYPQHLVSIHSGDPLILSVLLFPD